MGPGKNLLLNKAEEKMFIAKVDWEKSSNPLVSLGVHHDQMIKCTFDVIDCGNNGIKGRCVIGLSDRVKGDQEQDSLNESGHEAHNVRLFLNYVWAMAKH